MMDLVVAGRLPGLDRIVLHTSPFADRRPDGAGVIPLARLGP